MPIYDVDTFDKSLIPLHFKKEIQTIFEMAVMLGWKFHVTGAQSVTIISYDERKKYHFGRRNSNSLQRVKRDLIKYAEPEKLALANTMVTSNDSMISKAAAAALPALGDAGTLVDERPEPREPRRARVQKPEGQDTVAMEDIAPDDSESEPEPEAGEPEQELHIVREGPMLAKASEGKGYESQVAIERLWSDGSTDYKCVECDYTSTKRLSVRSHRQVHIRKGIPKADREQPRFAADIPDAVTYRPRQSRIDALAEVLMQSFANGEEPDFGEVARTALTWTHEQSKKGTALAAEHEDMGPEDVLNRIRSLLDDGSYLRAQRDIERMRQEMVAVQQEMEVMKRKAEEAERRAQQARQTLKAFTDLATELSSESESEEAKAG